MKKQGISIHEASPGSAEQPKKKKFVFRCSLFGIVEIDEAGKGGELTHDETTIITGALDLVVDLEILIKAGQPQERKNAEKILPIVKNQHLLLCTLLIGNALAMEALPIFIDALLPAWGAILISVTLILAFGEIIPQALCSRYGLSIGAKLSIVVLQIIPQALCSSVKKTCPCHP
ncbi:hypothetical protein OIU76_027807 [Salix suchowensis]|nr:hypothetical protein OIU76_027807 [Salix suchowensis]